MNKEEKFRCMKDAISAHGDTQECQKWYKKWLDKDTNRTGQYSFSCALMKDCFELCFGNEETKSKQAKLKFTIMHLNKI